MKINTFLIEQTDFTDNEKNIADYILSHKDDILNWSIQKLAKETYTSTSAVMRLCAKLNLSGYREFKILYAQELSSKTDTMNEIDPNFPFSKDDSVGEIANQLEDLTVQSLKEARKTLSISDIRKACKILHQAKNVAIFGIGDAYLSGLTFQARLMRAGVNFLTAPVYGEQGHLAQTLSHGDAGLLLSYSGITESTVNCAEILKSAGAATICITADPSSPLAKLSNISLILPAKETKFHRIASFFSQTCMEYYLNVMYSTLYVMDYDSHAQKSID